MAELGLNALEGRQEHRTLPRQFGQEGGEVLASVVQKPGPLLRQTPEYRQRTDGVARSCLAALARSLHRSACPSLPVPAGALSGAEQPIRAADETGCLHDHLPSKVKQYTFSSPSRLAGDEQLWAS